MMLRRRDFLRAVGAVGVALSTAHHPASARTHVRRKPNIVIIYTDDQGYGDVSVLNPGAKFLTPHMDRIAREGMIFTDGHCSDTVCTPSRYGLLTGRYSWRTPLKRGVVGADGDCIIPDDRMTLASLLRDQGYNTAMIGKWHLYMQFPGTKGDRDWSQPIEDGPWEKGFDYFFGIPASMNYGVLTYIEDGRITEVPSMWTHKKDAGDTFRFMPPYDTESKSRGDIEVAPNFIDSKVLERFTEKTVAYIDKVAPEAKRGKPFFVYMPLTSPHLPHSPDDAFRKRSDIGTYGDFMIETDHRVGQVLEALDRHGLTEDTLVIFSSDNGAETNYVKRIKEHDHYSNGKFRGGKRDIYEGGHRVPFFVRWPAAIKPGTTCDDTVCQTDFLATFADLLGVTLPSDAGEDSYSLLPALLGQDYAKPLRGPVIHHSGSGHFAIRDGRWKLNMFRGSGGSQSPKFIKPKRSEPLFELYDLQNDPAETSNLCEKHPEIVARLEQRITQIVTQGRSTPGPAQKNDGAVWWKQLTWLSEQENHEAR